MWGGTSASRRQDAAAIPAQSKHPGKFKVPSEYLAYSFGVLSSGGYKRLQNQGTLGDTVHVKCIAGIMSWVRLGGEG